MKIHKLLVNAVAETLREIFVNGRHADKCLEHTFKKNPQWGSRDRRFVAEGVYDCVRNYRLYAQLAQGDRNFWFITAVWMVLKGYEIPSWQEFVHVDPAFILQQKERLCAVAPIRESFPDWLWEKASNELGKDNWEKEATALNQTAPVTLRVNTLKVDPELFEKTFKNEGTELKRSPLYPIAFELMKRENIFRNEHFKEGWFEVQDAGSQLIGEFTDPAPGQLVVDACAGAGGKSLHLASLMKNKGRIISMDTEQWKLDECKKRAVRAGAQNIQVKLIGEEQLSVLNEKADIVLLDVPCSGTGVIKRNPDTKWKLTEDGLRKTLELQKKIIKEYSAMVKPGGKLVYSTCSIFPSENRKIVDEFKEGTDEFTFIKDRTLLPSGGTDGFYMAELRRKI